MQKPDFAELIRTKQNDQLRAYLDMNPALAEQTTASGVSLLLYAAYCRNPFAVEVIRALRDDLELHEAAAVGDAERIHTILSQDPNRINEVAPDGFGPLGLASYFGQLETATLLIRMGANINQASANDFRVTPLHSAAATSNLAMAELLISHGADINARQQSGVTALHSAAHNGQKKLVVHLLDHGADPTLTTNDGITPAEMAETDGHPEIADLIRSRQI